MRGHLPSVTEILASVGLSSDLPISPERRDYYLARGRALHAAIHYEAEGALDDSTVHPDIAGGLSAYRKFVAETGHVPHLSELELEHPAWRFMGHPDRLGYVNDKFALIDFKTNSVDLRCARLQLGGYDLLLQANPDKVPVKIEQHLILQLRLDGTYALHPVIPDTQTFLAAVLVYQAKQQRKPEAV